MGEPIPSELRSLIEAWVWIWIRRWKWLLKWTWVWHLISILEVEHNYIAAVDIHD